MLLPTLRAKTRPYHDALECRLDILNPGFSLAQYQRLLRLFHAYYRPLESLIPAYSDAPDRWITADRRKAHLLADDLASFDQRHEPSTPHLPDVSSPFRQLGCMYVLEGATLGGQVVLRHLRPRLNLNGAGTRFFASYGANVGGMWRSFCDHLESHATATDAHDEIIGAASSTFASLDAHLCKGGF